MSTPNCDVNWWTNVEAACVSACRWRFGSRSRTMRRHLHRLLGIRREESREPALADVEARITHSWSRCRDCPGVAVRALKASPKGVNGEGACTDHGRSSFDGLLTE